MNNARGTVKYRRHEAVPLIFDKLVKMQYKFVKILTIIIYLDACLILAKNV